MNLPVIADSQVPTTNSSSAILPGAPWLVAHKSMLGVERPYKITLNGRDAEQLYSQWGDDVSRERG